MQTSEDFWLDPKNGEPRKEVKIGIIMEDHKVKNREDYWQRAFGKLPKKFFDLYVFDREEIGTGLTSGTTFIGKYYKLKEGE